VYHFFLLKREQRHFYCEGSPSLSTNIILYKSEIFGAIFHTTAVMETERRTDCKRASLIWKTQTR